MRVTELIKQLEKLGYTDKTQICFGFLNSHEGEFYETDIIRIDEVLKQYRGDLDIVKAKVVSSEISVCKEFMNSQAFIDINIELEII